MSLALGGLSNAAASITTAVGKQKSLKEFLSTMSKYGLQIKSRYEVNFSGFQDITFFVTNISTPSVKMNTTNVYFDNKLVEIPVNYEYEHNFSMTILNDAKGYLYSTVTNFVVNDTASLLSNSGYTMTIKTIGDDNCPGSIIKLNGVRFVNCGGLDFDSSDSGISTFQVQCTAIDFSVGPGQLGKVSGIAGAVSGLAGGTSNLGKLFS